MFQPLKFPPTFSHFSTFRFSGLFFRAPLARVLQHHSQATQGDTMKRNITATLAPSTTISTLTASTAPTTSLVIRCREGLNLLESAQIRLNLLKQAEKAQIQVLSIYEDPNIPNTLITRLAPLPDDLNAIESLTTFLKPIFPKKLKLLVEDNRKPETMAARLGLQTTHVNPALTEVGRRVRK